MRFDMARAAALKADLAMLEGTGGTQIKGLITYSGIAHAHRRHHRRERRHVPAGGRGRDGGASCPTRWTRRRRG